MNHPCHQPPAINQKPGLKTYIATIITKSHFANYRTHTITVTAIPLPANELVIEPFSCFKKIFSATYFDSATKILAIEELATGHPATV
jgi:hypothetical protein